MTRFTFLRTTALFALLAASPALLAAQNAGAPHTPGPRELEQMFGELQRLHMELEIIQNRALEDPELSKAQEELGETIQRAMENLDPTMPEWMARAMVVESESHAAQQAGDEERVDSLVAERHLIEERYFALQRQVTMEPTIAMRIASFQSDLQAKMTEVDPRVATLIGRLRELEAALRAAASRS